MDYCILPTIQPRSVAATVSTALDRSSYAQPVPVVAVGGSVLSLPISQAVHKLFSYINLPNVPVFG